MYKQIGFTTPSCMLGMLVSEKGVSYIMPCHWRRSGVFIVNIEHISRLVLVFLLLTLSKKMTAGLTPTLEAALQD